MFVPESAKLTLGKYCPSPLPNNSCRPILMTRAEELDVVFSVDTKTHARFQLRQLGRFMRRNVLLVLQSSCTSLKAPLLK
jgi:hypothetical protein